MKNFFLVLIVCVCGCLAACQATKQTAEEVGQLAQSESAVTNPTQAELEAVKSPCDDVADNAEAELCARREFEQADAELSQLYNKILTDLKEFQTRAKTQDKSLEEKYRRDEENLRLAQDSWIIYRKLNCQAEREAALDPATAGFTGASCLQRVTEDRIENLRAVYEK